MNDQLQKEKKKILTLRIKQNIEGEEWQKLVDALPVAEEAAISKPLLLKAYILGAEYLEQKEDWVRVIKYFNKARSINPGNLNVLDKLISAFESFYSLYKAEFSKQDLKLLSEPLKLILDFHNINFPKHKKIVRSGNELIQKIEYQLKYNAVDKIESQATFRTQQIHNAISDDMTFEQIQSEFARIIEPTVRDLLEEKEKEKKQKKKTNSKKNKKKE